MPDGYRRGGSYTRNGRTYYRRGTRIAPRRGIIAAGAVVIGLSLIAGGPLVAHPILVGVLAAGAAGYVLRKPIRRQWRKGRPWRRRFMKRAMSRVEGRYRNRTVVHPVTTTPGPAARRGTTSRRPPAHVRPMRIAGPDDWRDPHGPVTEKQRYRLAEHGESVYEGMTKAAASKVISGHEERRPRPV